MISRLLAILILTLVMDLSACSGGTPEQKSFTIEIKDRTVQHDKALIRVNQGDMVTLWWKSDETAVIHLHGYDIQQVVKPGISTVFTFKAYATGRYPITAHSFGKAVPRKAQEEIPLAYLEVMPR